MLCPSHQEAEALANRCLEAAKQLHGESHASVASCLNCLSEILKDQERWADQQGRDLGAELERGHSENAGRSRKGTRLRGKGGRVLH